METQNIEPLAGASVLVLEDEFLIALDAEQILRDLGVRQVAIAATLSEAEDRTRAGDFDVALLDVNVNGEMSFGLAQTLRARGVPVVFTTGYELKDRVDTSVDPEFCVSKPYTSERLRQALCAALAARRRSSPP